MLQAISWGNFLTAAALLLAAYYIVVGTVFYSGEIREYLLTRKKTGSAAAPAADDSTDGTVSFESLEAFIHEIDGILEETGNQVAKDQLLPQLKTKLAGYDGLRRPAFRVAIINHITTQAEIICGVRISAQELEN